MHGEPFQRSCKRYFSMSAEEPAEDVFWKVIGAGKGRWPLLVAEGGFPAKFSSSHWGEWTLEDPSSAMQALPLLQHLLPGHSHAWNHQDVVQIHPAAPGKPAHFQQLSLWDSSNWIIVPETMHLYDCCWSFPKILFSLWTSEGLEILSFVPKWLTNLLGHKKRTYAPVFQLTVSASLKPAGNAFQQLDLHLNLLLVGCTAGKAVWPWLHFVTGKSKSCCQHAPRSVL